MFEAKVRSDVLREVVNAVNILVDEAKFNLSKSEVSIRSVDPAHVAMVSLVLGKKAFEEFSAGEGEIGIDLEKLKDVLRLARGDEVISLRHEEDKNRLVVSVGNLTRRMSLVDTSSMSEPKLPNLEFLAEAVVRTEDLKQAVKASESISDHVTLTCNPDSFEIQSKGETDSVDLKLQKDLLEKLECKDTVSSMYPLEYFSKMINAISPQNVSLHLGNRYPIKIEFQIANGEGRGEYLLAPRIENE